MWIGSKADSSFDALTSFLNDSIIEFKIDLNSTEDECISFGKYIYNKQVELGRKLHVEILIDLKDLHKIDKFIANEIKNIKKQKLPERQ